MYRPAHFREDRIDVLHDFIHEHSLSTLVTMTAEGLIANHIPLILDPEPAPFGTLRGHVARANPLWRDSLADVHALAIFHGPHAYITPSWYPTKQETGHVVPTYNYVVVHAHGPLLTYTDPSRLERHLRALTDRHEAPFETPWKVDDAPADFFQNLLSGIVGIEIPIQRLEGKWKVSQNRTPADRAGAAEGLRATGHSDMAGLISAKNGDLPTG
jgi:transcriptional regulator